MTSSPSRHAKRVLLLLFVLGVGAGLGSCGGGGVAAPAPITGVFIYNAPVDFDGFVNVRTIIAVDFGFGPVGVNIFPDEALFFDLAPGSYFIDVTYDDLLFERDQFPFDPVDVFTGDQFQVDFVY